MLQIKSQMPFLPGKIFFTTIFLKIIPISGYYICLMVWLRFTSPLNWKLHKTEPCQLSKSYAQPLAWDQVHGSPSHICWMFPVLKPSSSVSGTSEETVTLLRCCNLRIVKEKKAPSQTSAILSSRSQIIYRVIDASSPSGRTLHLQFWLLNRVFIWACGHIAEG